MAPVPVSPKDLKKLKQYVANLKKWLRLEHQWQRQVMIEVNRLRRKLAEAGDPQPIKPPPPPPFKP